ncbi:MAG: hypothetical protein ACP5HH_07335 [Fervidicoccaceae archaeon]
MEEKIILENEKNEIITKIHNSKGFIIKNNNYEIVKPWYTDLPEIKGQSIVDLLRDKQIPFFGEYEITEIGYDYIKIRIPGYEKYKLIVFVEEIGSNRIRIFPQFVIVSP